MTTATNVTTITRHAFLSPGHNSWLFWTSEGSKTLTNPGASHRALEVLSYALDAANQEGWEVKGIYTDQGGAPNIVLLTRQEVVNAE